LRELNRCQLTYSPVFLCKQLYTFTSQLLLRRSCESQRIKQQKTSPFRRFPETKGHRLLGTSFTHALRRMKCESKMRSWESFKQYKTPNKGRCGISPQIFYAFDFSAICRKVKDRRKERARLCGFLLTTRNQGHYAPRFFYELVIKFIASKQKHLNRLKEKQHKQ